MMTQRIIKEHEGLLRVQTEPKKGSTFQIFLKLAKA
jgi:signal transduction histidine kinase